MSVLSDYIASYKKEMADFAEKNYCVLYEKVESRRTTEFPRVVIDSQFLKKLSFNPEKLIFVDAGTNFPIPNENTQKVTGVAQKLIDRIPVPYGKTLFVGGLTDPLMKEFNIKYEYSYDSLLNDYNEEKKALRAANKAKKALLPKEEKEKVSGLFNQDWFVCEDVSYSKTSLNKIIERANASGATLLWQIAKGNECADENGATFGRRSMFADKIKTMSAYLPKKYWVVYVAPTIWRLYNAKLPKYETAEKIAANAVVEAYGAVKAKAEAKRYYISRYFSENERANITESYKKYFENKMNNELTSFLKDVIETFKNEDVALTRTVSTINAMKPSEFKEIKVSDRIQTGELEEKLEEKYFMVDVGNLLYNMKHSHDADIEKIARFIKLVDKAA